MGEGQHRMALVIARPAPPEREPAAVHRGVHRRAPGRLSAWLALLPMAVTLVVAYPGAANREMWEDEYATYHASTISWRALGRLLTHLDLVHSLYYMFMRGWIPMAGDSMLAMR